MYMKALKKEITRVSTAYDRVLEEPQIFVSCQNVGSFCVSFDLLSRRTVSELWVLICKTLETSHLNVLLHERLREYASRNSPQTIDVPLEVKFYEGTSVQTVGLDPVSLAYVTATRLVNTEHLLRTSGFAFEKKTEFADIIKEYCEHNIKRYSQLKNRLKKVTPQPVMPSSFASETDQVLDEELLEKLEEVE